LHPVQSRGISKGEPSAFHLLTGLSEPTFTILRPHGSATHLPRNGFSSLSHEGRIAPLGRSMNTVFSILTVSPPNRPLSGVGVNAELAQALSEVFTPLPKRCLINVQSLALLAHGLYDHMHMRIALIRMQRHRVPML